MKKFFFNFIEKEMFRIKEAWAEMKDQAQLLYKKWEINCLNWNLDSLNYEEKAGLRIDPKEKSKIFVKIDAASHANNEIIYRIRARGTKHQQQQTVTR